MPNFEDTLFQLDQALQKRGLPAMDRDTLREVAQRIQHPEVRQSLQAGQLTVQSLVNEVMQAMDGMQSARQPQGQLPGAPVGPAPALGAPAGMPPLMPGQMGGQ